MKDVFEKLNSLSENIKLGKKKLSGIRHPKGKDTKKVHNTLVARINDDELQFKAICYGSIDVTGTTVYSIIKEKVINAWKEDKGYFQIPKPPKIKSLEDCVIFEVLKINEGGLVVRMDNELSLLLLFGEKGTANREKLVELIESDENERND